MPIGSFQAPRGWRGLAGDIPKFGGHFDERRPNKAFVEKWELWIDIKDPRSASSVGCGRGRMESPEAWRSTANMLASHDHVDGLGIPTRTGSGYSVCDV